MSGPPDHLRRPPAWLLAVAGAGAAGLLWALAGWGWTVPAVALAVAVLVALSARLVGVLLPREGRWIADRAGVLAVAGALVVLVAQSSIWAVLLALGVLALAVALTQPARMRRAGVLAGAVLALVGAAGVVVLGIADRAERAAAYQAAGDYTRAQLLPDTPADALVALMNAVARPDDVGCALFTDAGRAALSAAYRAPDCPAALRAAGAGVVDPDAYPRLEADSIAVQLGEPAGTPALVDGCSVRWRPTLDELLNGRPIDAPTPGPPLARITVSRPYGGDGWAVDNIERCTP
jgi:hypothetical protein